MICDTPVLGDDFIFEKKRRTKIIEEHNRRLFHDNSEYEDVSCQHLNTYIVSCPQGGMTELPSPK